MGDLIIIFLQPDGYLQIFSYGCFVITARVLDDFCFIYAERVGRDMHAIKFCVQKPVKHIDGVFIPLHFLQYALRLFDFQQRTYCGNIMVIFKKGMITCSASGATKESASRQAKKSPLAIAKPLFMALAFPRFF